MKSILITILSAGAVCLNAFTAQAREWTSTDGRKIEAQFISARDGKVTIQRTNGKRYTLSLEKLSEADQNWVEEKLAGTEKTEEKGSLGSAPAKSNKDRIYVTGYSMGGFGTFTLLAQEPKLFAAAAPIAGGGSPASAGQFKKVPVWVFHGSDDEVVKVDQSRNMVEALKKARAPVQYTEMAGEGHGIAGKVYDDPKFHEWMFEQTKGKKEKP